ncbi:ArsR/SmtB family transcription factor [Promethearchaeum syntrophicum]|uniref:ArsR/SmtB family transcription factor n=1 Tax=Promethearchaeum syntrophicum TaxID=2594042 RepID=A0A5B9DEM2_9ARCH|nr:helix-turn-helix domain-containing protein [Candidatus Prometheoarchaeum syntrophicum]QEE17554.1 hypothetical protein DSAG12_03391 [Candidatus Prometheoarchaeum syntrophicum]
MASPIVPIDRIQIFDILQEETNLQIFFQILTHSDLSLSDFDILIDKSKPTLSRRLRKMVDAGLLTTYDEKVRGVFAKHYRLNLKFMEPLPHFTSSELGSLSPHEMQDIILKLKNSLISVANLFANILRNTPQSLELLGDTIEDQRKNLLEDPKYYLSFYPLSEREYFKFSQLAKELEQKLNEFIKSEEKKNPDHVKNYIAIINASPQVSDSQFQKKIKEK